MYFANFEVISALISGSNWGILACSVKNMTIEAFIRPGNSKFHGRKEILKFKFNWYKMSSFFHGKHQQRDYREGTKDEKTDQHCCVSNTKRSNLNWHLSF